MTKTTVTAALSAALLAACPPSKSTSTCTTGQTTCDGGCKTLATDPANCGACGNACAAGESCSGGSCACPSGQTACGALCVTLSSDALNCGACGAACHSGQLCDAGACVCGDGFTNCPLGGQVNCVDTASDRSNCGGCGQACDVDAGQVCFAGSCASYCDGGLVDCGGDCVDLATNPYDCGSCTTACATGQLCTGSACACPAGQTLCDGGGCEDLSTSQQNCGACGTTCASWQLCRAGGCVGPDLLVACSNLDVSIAPEIANSVVGVDSASGQILLPPQPIAAPPPDGGAELVAQIAWLLYTDPSTLWVLDTTNSQIDVLDVSNWPATVKGSIAVGSDPNQLLLCGGIVVVLNSLDNTVQGISPTTMKTVAEVNLGAGENPEYAACDGNHTVYVTDWLGGDVKSIDVSQTTWSVGDSLAVPAADVAALPDGGLAWPTPGGIAYVATDAGAEVLVTLENLDPAAFYAPAGPSTVLALDPALAGVTAAIDPGAGCLDAQFLTPDPATGAVYETCTGNYTAATGVLASIAVPANQAGPLVALPLGSPTPTALLANGRLAIGDWGGSGAIVLWNPADGGLQEVVVCPTVDGGQVPDETVGAVTPAP